MSPAATPTHGGRAEAWAGRAFVAPALLLIAVFFLFPVLAGFFLSLTDFDLYGVADPSASASSGRRTTRPCCARPCSGGRSPTPSCSSSSAVP